MMSFTAEVVTVDNPHIFLAIGIALIASAIVIRICYYYLKRRRMP
jgi:hypothetical protein